MRRPEKARGGFAGMMRHQEGDEEEDDEDEEVKSEFLITLHYFSCHPDPGRDG